MLKESIIEGIKNTFVFKGEMSREHFWCYWLVMLVAIYIVPQIISTVGFAVLVFDKNSATPFYIAYGSMMLGYLLYLMTISAKVRRLHDIGFSGLWVLAEYILSAILLFFSTRMFIAFATGGISYLFQRYTLLTILFILYIVLKLFLLILYFQKGEDNVNMNEFEQ